MTGIVGNLKIVSVGSSSIVHIGDSVYLAPQSTAKTFAGAGSFNTGDYLRTYNTYSQTNTYDPDVVDTSLAPFSRVGGI